MKIWYEHNIFYMISSHILWSSIWVTWTNCPFGKWTFYTGITHRFWSQSDLYVMWLVAPVSIIHLSKKNIRRCSNCTCHVHPYSSCWGQVICYRFIQHFDNFLVLLFGEIWVVCRGASNGRGVRRIYGNTIDLFPFDVSIDASTCPSCILEFRMKNPTELNVLTSPVTVHAVEDYFGGAISLPLISSCEPRVGTACDCNSPVSFLNKNCIRFVERWQGGHSSTDSTSYCHMFHWASSRTGKA